MAAQVETGTPYMLYKDACNAKSNQKNLGTIKSSNLCTEIVEYTSSDEVWLLELRFVLTFIHKVQFHMVIYQPLSQADIATIPTRSCGKTGGSMQSREHQPIRDGSRTPSHSTNGAIIERRQPNTAQARDEDGDVRLREVATDRGGGYPQPEPCHRR